MSIEALNDFRARIADDAALQQICADAIAAKDPQRVVDAGAQRGFAFSVEELEACVAEGELSDAELELVAGGFPAPPAIKTVSGSGFGR